MNFVLIENVRSAFNVGNIIRTADALGYSVILSGYTPTPTGDLKVKKSSLGAEESVSIVSFRNPKEAITYAKEQKLFLIAAEKTSNSIPLDTPLDFKLSTFDWLCIIVGNEKTGVLPETLGTCDKIIHIPMKGQKESLNVGQAAAIMMRELAKTTRT